MKITINHKTDRDQKIYLSGNIPELGGWDETQAVPMLRITPSEWELSLNTDAQELQYRFLIMEEGRVIRREWGLPHTIRPETGKEYIIHDRWQDFPEQYYLYTSGFSEVFFAHQISAGEPRYYDATVLLRVDCPYAQKGEVVKICGSPPQLGGWNPSHALSLQFTGHTSWQILLDASQLPEELEYKLLICDEATGQQTSWEEGFNRTLVVTSVPGTVQVNHLSYRHAGVYWQGTGVNIPVFSLRSQESYGIGEFPDIKKLIDWAALTGQQVIQLLPVNDTTNTYSWYDSYPYNAISIYALHPVYLGLQDYPLKDEALLEQYREKAAALNVLETVDYENVVRLKRAYLQDLFDETGEKVLSGEGFLDFYAENKDWLFPYACFSCLRDLYQTADFSQWNEYRTYNREKLELLILDKRTGEAVRLTYFIQYLLHQQLKEVKEYAHRNQVILKGDIPIGINRHSVEAWTEPHLFHLDMQTGAPPDAFAVSGQNWGFPTYNWNEMAKDDYQWWQKRFRKMADYFDAYRIDHILGFFRIWEIPQSSIQGILGHFSPALPLPVEEIEQYGIAFDPQWMTQPYIHASFLPDLFTEEYVPEVISLYLHEIGKELYQLNETCDTQVKINQLFEGKNDDKANVICSGLYSLCNEILFIKDPEKAGRYHPRIIAQASKAYGRLTYEEEEAFSKLYEDFFYHRHNDLWKEEALKKLPALISATPMLPCGEDLGMIPATVPEVMQTLQILSLELERMPKEYRMFADLSALPYLSVCTTSTHDMPPLRSWWSEDTERAQNYYNHILNREGTAPEECTVEICKQIVQNHLGAPSMLVILPIQDWLSIDGKLRKPDAGSERINDPANPHQQWRYRMHLTLEELLEANEYNNTVRQMIEAARKPKT